MDRVVVLVDMDCFYVQVEQRENPILKGKPCAVVQYNEWKGGSIIAVSYEARAKGVSRKFGFRGDDAKKVCPEIELVKVPEVRGKADLTKYRNAGAEVIKVLCQFSDRVERASVDEAYIDLTSQVKAWTDPPPEPSHLEHTFVVGHDQNLEDDDDDVDIRGRGLTRWVDQSVSDSTRQLLIGAAIAEKMRAAVFSQTGFRCSAGVSYNKVLAKLACGLHKPNRQTILPPDSLELLFTQLPIKELRHLGGKFGRELVQEHGLTFVGDLVCFSREELWTKFGEKNGSWLFELCRGNDSEPVKDRTLAKSIGCSKNFRGKQQLDTDEKVYFWLSQMVDEIEERLIIDKALNKRVAKLLSLNITFPDRTVITRACSLTKYDAPSILRKAFATIVKVYGDQPRWNPPIAGMGLAAGKFTSSDVTTASITSFFSSNSRTALDTHEHRVQTNAELDTPKSKRTTQAASSVPLVNEQAPNQSPLATIPAKPDFNHQGQPAISTTAKNTDPIKVKSEPAWTPPKSIIIKTEPGLSPTEPRVQNMTSSTSAALHQRNIQQCNDDQTAAKQTETTVSNLSKFVSKGKASITKYLAKGMSHDYLFKPLSVIRPSEETNDLENHSERLVLPKPSEKPTAKKTAVNTNGMHKFVRVGEKTDHEQLFGTEGRKTNRSRGSIKRFLCHKDAVDEEALFACTATDVSKLNVCKPIYKYVHKGIDMVTNFCGAREKQSLAPSGRGFEKRAGVPKQLKPLEKYLIRDDDDEGPVRSLFSQLEAAKCEYDEEPGPSEKHKSVKPLEKYLSKSAESSVVDDLFNQLESSHTSTRKMRKRKRKSHSKYHRISAMLKRPRYGFIKGDDDLTEVVDLTTLSQDSHINNELQLSDGESHNDFQLSGGESHNDFQLADGESHNELQLSDGESHNELQLSDGESHNELQLSDGESHNELQLSGGESHNDFQLSDGESHNELQPSDRESHNDFQLSDGESHNELQPSDHESHNDFQLSDSESHNDFQLSDSESQSELEGAEGISCDSSLDHTFCLSDTSNDRIDDDIIVDSNRE